MNADRQVGTLLRLVAWREISTRIRAKAWRITTLLLMAIVIGVALLTKFTGGSSEVTVGVLPPAQTISTSLVSTGATLGKHITTRGIADRASGLAQVRDGKIDALVSLSGDTATVVVKKDIDSGLKSTLSVLVREVATQHQIVALGGDPTDFAAAVAAAKVDVTRMTPPATYSNQHLILGVAAGIIIFIALQINGQFVAQGVVEEKSTRVVELLLATLRPWELMVGKVLGIAVVGLSQLALIAGAGLGAGLALGTLDLSVGQASGTLLWLVVWFVLGFFAYALAIAAAAALVSRLEDVQTVLIPVLAPLIASYVIGIAVVPQHPDGTLARVLSMLPPSAPAIMPIRIAIGSASALDMVVSLVLMIVTIPALALLAGRIYRNAVVRSGARVKLRDALSRR